MENLEQQTQVINLGKLLVKQLDLEDSNDTLSRWMVHYLAGKIFSLESLPTGEEKDNSEKECFELILKLWKHRWLFPFGKRPLEKFEIILKTIERLNPEEEKTFFYRQFENDLSGLPDKDAELKPIQACMQAILEIDKAARTWVEYILHHAALAAKDKNTKAYVENSSSLLENGDTKAIEILVGKASEKSTDVYEKKYELERIKRRIEELEKFSKLSESILNGYKQELRDIENS